MEEKFETIILVKQTFYRGVIYLLHNFGRGEKRIPVVCSWTRTSVSDVWNKNEVGIFRGTRTLVEMFTSISAILDYCRINRCRGREKRLSLKVGVLVFLISFCYRNENEKREKNKLKAKNGSNLNWVEPDSWLELDSDSNLARNLQCVLSDKLWCYTGISSPEKSRNNTREKIRYFFTCVWYRQSAADTSLAFRTTRSGWWMNGKAFTILNPRPLSEHFRIMATKKIKNAYHLQTVTFELS